MLFEIAILEAPTKKEAEEGKTERLVFGPRAVVANDSQSAAIAAVLDATNGEHNPSAPPAQDLAKIDRARMKVLVRPFV